ncbi:ABC transporter substrate-binding protein [Companilactobacillus allii]|uniref:ABC transporter substrate-binding protein n=1 Tax=Companilactobacillus allii TaxID=1847728 RepID=A0A1P8Q2X2_9LACO|nr:ABC transporter substrate-binding protein [Companilactobacillus allii]APX72176.1 ABC transporter substrate-binding protein [Companilactobacillus allii]USQ69274.1 ABC transporter substrate-binding protein [Companilactobacillus allii]
MRGKKIVALLLLLVPFLILGGCNKKESKSTDLPTSYSKALKDAKGQTVTYYGFGGTETQNRWIDDVVTPMMKKKGITVKRVPMDIDDILKKLTTEKEANKKTGNIDVVWINGENFYTAKKLDLLAGPLDSKLIPNMKTYISSNDPDVKRDMGTSIDKLEVPYGNAQLVMIGSKQMFNGDYPTSAEKMMDWAKENPGKLTYVAPPDFTGSAFIRNIIYETVGYDAINKAPATKKGIYKVIKPSLDYLNELKPYLWEQGKTYPKTTAQMDKMFANHQIALDFSYNQMYAATQRSDGKFTDDAHSFVFDKGTVGNYNYLAVPKTSANKAAAVVLINTMLSKEAQTQRLKLKYGAVVPPYSEGKTPQSITDKLDDASNKYGTVPMDTLSKKRIPEISGKKIPIIEDLWKEYVLNAD